MLFKIQQQRQSNWCWAAVAVSVDRYFSGNSCLWTQCKLASDVLANALGNPDCCAQPSVCNRPWYLQHALSAVGRFKSLGSVLSFSDIEMELKAKLPLCVRIGWFGGSAHFVVIYGCRPSPSGPLVDVADPFYGYSTLLYKDFVSHYQHMGAWTCTYFVQP